VTTHFSPVAGGSISDLDDATAGNRKLDTAFALRFGQIMIANNSDAAAYLVTADDAVTSGRMIPAGATATFGPSARGVDLWLYGTGSGDAYYSFDLVVTEG
jgi:hypothetical protein